MRLEYHELFALLASREGSNIQPIWTHADTASYLGTTPQNSEEVLRRLKGLWDRFQLQVKQEQEVLSQKGWSK